MKLHTLKKKFIGMDLRIHVRILNLFKYGREERLCCTKHQDLSQLHYT